MTLTSEGFKELRAVAEAEQSQAKGYTEVAISLPELLALLDAYEDAQRLDWLETADASLSDYPSSCEGRWWICTPAGDDHTDCYAKPTLREAIDAARESR